MPALAAPIIVMLLGHLVARAAAHLRSRRWSWLLPALVYWATMALLIGWIAPPESLVRWSDMPGGHWGWAGLAIGIGVAHLPFLLMNGRALRGLSAIGPWLLFALINGTLEELFWRGLLLDAAHGWAPWVAVLTVSMLFAVNHPLTFGPVSAALRHPVTLVGALAMGIGWSWVALSTGSLLWPVAGHILTNLGAMAAPVFMGVVAAPIGPSQHNVA